VADVTRVQQIARAVLQNLPYVRCIACLSRQTDLTEPDVRDAAKAMIFRDDFHVARRMCQICGRADDMLVSGKERGPCRC
jgi:hypothetical protein